MQHNIYVTGVSWKPINSASEALSYLRQGALSRTTAATAMNSQSSRSHAVFTINIQQKRFVKHEVYMFNNQNGVLKILYKKKLTLG